MVIDNVLINKSENIKINLTTGESKVFDMKVTDENSLCLICSDGKCFLVKNHNTFEIPYKCQNTEMVDGKIVVYEYDFNLLKTVFNIYDINEGRVIFNEGIVSNIFLMENGFIANDENTVSYKTLDKNSAHWDFSINQFKEVSDWKGDLVKAKIEKIFGLHNNTFWFQLTGFRLIGLDMFTGELKHNLENIVKGGKNNNHLDINNGILITLSHDYYSEFDLDNLQVKKQIVLDNENGLKINGFSFYQGDNNLYFYGNMDNSNFPNAFGIFDRDQEEITFYQKADSKNQYFFETPKANNSLVAIKDSNNTLFVFDKSKEQTA